MVGRDELKIYTRAGSVVHCQQRAGSDKHLISQAGWNDVIFLSCLVCLPLASHDAAMQHSEFVTGACPADAPLAGTTSIEAFLAYQA